MLLFGGWRESGRVFVRGVAARAAHAFFLAPPRRGRTDTARPVSYILRIP
jgi:hypothetical protein